jgi:hypothetical protein
MVKGRHYSYCKRKERERGGMEKKLKKGKETWKERIKYGDGRGNKERIDERVVKLHS